MGDDDAGGSVQPVRLDIVEPGDLVQVDKWIHGVVRLCGGINVRRVGRMMGRAKSEVARRQWQLPVVAHVNNLDPLVADAIINRIAVARHADRSYSEFGTVAA